LDAGRESFRSGTEGTAWANALIARPWDFDLEDIRVPLTIWQGDQGTNVPMAMGQYLAQQIPGSQYRILANDGHRSSLTNHFEEILSELAGA
jgi:pimeloyl-ACP methyl ester carboxylesterase